MKQINNNGNLPELDGIRGSAFLLVLIGHIFSTNPKIIPYLVGVPKFGVWMFFVLSSFLLSNYFLSQPERAYKPLEWINYVVRRFMRIYPLYTIVLIIYFLYHREINSISLIRDHLLLQKGIMQFWTMPVEITYYLILPFSILTMIWVCRINLKVTLLSTVVFIIVQQMISPYTKAIESSIHVFQYLPVFIFGSVGALIHQKLRLVETNRKIQTIFDCLSISIVIGLILITPYPMKHLFGHNPDHYLMNKFIFIGFACLVLILSIIHGSVIKKFFSTNVMRFFGKISYGGYLIHWIFLQIIISQYFKGLTVTSGILTFILTIFSATLFYYFIEQPCMKVNLLKFKKTKIKTLETTQ